MPRNNSFMKNISPSLCVASIYSKSTSCLSIKFLKLFKTTVQQILGDLSYKQMSGDKANRRKRLDGHNLKLLKTICPGLLMSMIMPLYQIELKLSPEIAKYSFLVDFSFNTLYLYNLYTIV